MKILLGSQSPRRRELLAGMDVDFRVVAIDADEHYPEGLTGGDIPYYISRAKAEAYDEPLAEDEVLLTADTIVWVPGDGESMGAAWRPHLHEDDNRRRDAHDKSVCTTCVPSDSIKAGGDACAPGQAMGAAWRPHLHERGVMLGKPRDEEEAGAMLRLLSGRMHEVYTGVTLKTREGMRTIVDKTEVWFRALTEEEIDYYVERYRPLDKAGAYGVQEWIGYVGVTRIVGSYFNVMGLPVERVWELLCDRQREVR